MVQSMKVWPVLYCPTMEEDEQEKKRKKKTEIKKKKGIENNARICEIWKRYTFFEYFLRTPSRYLFHERKYRRVRANHPTRGWFSLN